MVYGGLIGEGVVKSTDGGAHWVLSNAGMAPFLTRLTRVTAIAVDPSTPATVYAGTIRPQRQPFSGDVYKSTDGGATWTQLPHPHLGLFVTALAIDPSTPSTVYAMSGTVYKSTDGGLTWAVAGPADALLDVVAIDPVMPTTLYAGSSTPGLGFPLFKSIDGGASWVPINIGLGSLPIRAIAIDRFTRRRLYVATTAGVFRSTDGGVTWSSASLGLGTMDIFSLGIDLLAPTTLYAGTNAAGWRATAFPPTEPISTR